jgi:uncharacterized protein (DUF2235 family)
MLHLIGVTRPGADNLVRYAVSNYARTNPRWADQDWHQARQFASIMSRDVAGHHSVPVTYLGLWDTVKAPGILRRSMVWPFTRELPNVLAGRHAVSIDEKRRPFRDYLVEPNESAIEEVWFAGVHSDIGGGFLDKPCLGDIGLKWVVEGAQQAGLLLGDDLPLPALNIDNATATIHRMAWYWILLTYRRRPVPANAFIHASVAQRMATQPGYGRHLPRDAWADPGWLTDAPGSP